MTVKSTTNSRKIQVASASTILLFGVAALVALGLFWADRETDLLRQLDNAHYDFLAQRYTSDHVAPDIRVVLLDDRTIDDYGGEFPIERHRHITLLRGLNAVGAKTVTWDIVFRRETNTDPALADAFAELPNVIAFGARPDLGGGENLSDVFVGHSLTGVGHHNWPASDMEVGLQPVSIFQSSVAQLAHAAVSVDGDAVHRSVPLIIRINGHVYPSLTLATVMTYLGLARDDFAFDAPYLIIGPKALERPIRVPLDDHGRLLVSYVKDWQRSFFAQSYSNLNRSLAAFPEDLEEAFDSAITIVGASFAGSGDFIATPIEPSVPGVMLTINAVNTILTESFVRPASQNIVRGIIYTAPFFVALLFVLFRPVIVAPSLLLSGGGLIGGSDYLFAAQSFFLPTFSAVSAVIATGLVLTLISFILSYRLERRMATVLRRFVAPALLRELETNGVGRLRFEPARKELAIMFIDIAGFTKFSDESDARQVSTVLAEFYELALGIMFKHEGTVDKLMGDGIIVYWGAPDPVQNKEAKAIRAALELQSAFDTLASSHNLDLALRCGINAGDAYVGYFGGDRNAAYTLLGRSVNLAARLESNAPVGSVIVEKTMYQRTCDAFEFTALPPISAKGIAQPVEVWRVITEK